MQVELIRSREEIGGLAPAWEALWRQDPGADIFTSIDPFTAWLDGFAAAPSNDAVRSLDGIRVRPADDGPLDPYVLVAREGLEVAAIAPLVAFRGRWRGLPMRVRSLAVNPHLPQGGFVPRVRDGAASTALIRHLVAGEDWDLLLLEGIPSGSPAARGLREHVRTLGLAVVEEPPVADAYLPVRGTWNGYLAAKSGNFRRSLQRSGRDLERAGAVTVERHATPETVDAAMDTFMEVDRESWKAVSGESIALVPRLGAFYRRLATSCARKGRAEVWVLRVNGEAAAATLCLSDARSLHLYKRSCKERFTRAGLSPNLVLTSRIVQDAWSRGFEGVDFLSRAPYALRWASPGRSYARLAVFRSHALPAFVRLVERLSGGAAAARRALAGGLRWWGGGGRPTASAAVVAALDLLELA